ncbi:hypothetical protein F0562_022826 [Nyssa sinensis]|uniref:Uncharacterized protein n=1 Tax=Nyssa sinensis TaxID=561372 RepID=A0A5J5BG43_9ASTE|nr:hypothetical protein F0562_022826 [Nyssa sinensis]
MPAWKFVVQGDYVRVRSNNSSRSGSPDLDDVESPSSIESAGTTAAVDSGDPMSPLFCPSPDVDTKADSFIAKFRAGLRLEKMNSIKKKHGLDRLYRV